MLRAPSSWPTAASGRCKPAQPERPPPLSFFGAAFRRVGTQHCGGFEIIACRESFLAAAAQRTRNIRLGTGVVSLPYHQPFTLASRMMQLDHMARGRAMFGVGPGALIYDADKIGLKAADQRR